MCATYYEVPSDKSTLHILGSVSRSRSGSVHEGIAASGSLSSLQDPQRLSDSFYDLKSELRDEELGCVPNQVDDVFADDSVYARESTNESLPARESTNGSLGAVRASNQNLSDQQQPIQPPDSAVSAHENGGFRDIVSKH